MLYAFQLVRDAGGGFVWFMKNFRILFAIAWFYATCNFYLHLKRCMGVRDSMVKSLYSYKTAKQV